MDERVITFSRADIQALSLKYYGDELTGNELEELESLCSMRDWANADIDGWGVVLSQLLQSVINLIGSARRKRRQSNG